MACKTLHGAGAECIPLAYILTTEKTEAVICGDACWVKSHHSCDSCGKKVKTKECCEMLLVLRVVADCRAEFTILYELPELDDVTRVMPDVSVR